MGRTTREIVDEIAWEFLLEAVDMPHDILVLVKRAQYDLYFGPQPAEAYEGDDETEDAAPVPWPGYCTALRRIHDWASHAKIPHTVYVNLDSGEAMIAEPTGSPDPDTGEWIEPSWEDWGVVEGEEIYRLLFGELIGNGLRL